MQRSSSVRAELPVVAASPRSGMGFAQPLVAPRRSSSRSPDRVCTIGAYVDGSVFAEASRRGTGSSGVGFHLAGGVDGGIMGESSPVCTGLSSEAVSSPRRVHPHAVTDGRGSCGAGLPSVANLPSVGDSPRADGGATVAGGGPFSAEPPSFGDRSSVSHWSRHLHDPMVLLPTSVRGVPRSRSDCPYRCRPRFRRRDRRPLRRSWPLCISCPFAYFARWHRGDRVIGLGHVSPCRTPSGPFARRV